jgi:hypothetical protein
VKRGAGAVWRDVGADAARVSGVSVVEGAGPVRLIGCRVGVVDCGFVTAAWRAAPFGDWWVTAACGRLGKLWCAPIGGCCTASDISAEGGRSGASWCIPVCGAGGSAREPAAGVRLAVPWRSSIDDDKASRKGSAEVVD